MKYQVKAEKVEINVGDQFFGMETYSFAGRTWKHRYTVKAAEQKDRFGLPNVLLTVDIEAVDWDDWDSSRMIERDTKRWLAQCF